MRDLLLYYLPPILWILGYVIIASIPGLPGLKNLPIGIDKIVHAGVYFVLCWLVRRAFVRQDLVVPLKQRALLGAFIFSVVYGLLDEYRGGVLGHSASVLTLIAGVGGALLYVALATVAGSKGDAGGGMSPES